MAPRHKMIEHGSRFPNQRLTKTILAIKPLVETNYIRWHIILSSIARNRIYEYMARNFKTSSLSASHFIATLLQCIPMAFVGTTHIWIHSTFSSEDIWNLESSIRNLVRDKLKKTRHKDSHHMSLPRLAEMPSVNLRTVYTGVCETR